VSQDDSSTEAASADSADGAGGQDEQVGQWLVRRPRAARHWSGRRCRCHALARHSLQGGCRSEKRPGQPPGETRTHPHLIGQGVQT